MATLTKTIKIDASAIIPIADAIATLRDIKADMPWRTDIDDVIESLVKTIEKTIVCK